MHHRLLLDMICEFNVENSSLLWKMHKQALPKKSGI